MVFLLGQVILCSLLLWRQSGFLYMSSVLPSHLSLTHCRELGVSAISPGCKASATGAVAAAPRFVPITLLPAPPTHALNRFVSQYPCCRHMQLQCLKAFAWRCTHSLHEPAGTQYQDCDMIILQVCVLPFTGPAGVSNI